MADLGVLVPIVAALIAVNGLAAGPVLVGVGATVLVSGARYGMPWPVQPLKAVSAIAIASQLPPDLIHTAGLLLGCTLLGLTVTGATARLARWFTRPVVRSLQLAVGVLLVLSAVRLVTDPPGLLRPAGASDADPWLALATVVVVAVASARRWYAAGALVLLAGVAATIATSGLPTIVVPATRAWAGIGVPDLALLPSAFVLLVLPQLPLTFGNAVVGVSDLAAEHFPERSHRATPARVATSTGVANIASALIGGLPMCHGSSGFSAHVRLGARTGWMNVALGTALLAVGAFLPHRVVQLLTVLPVWALGGFLAYAGIRHALLVTDLRGRELASALVAGAAGLVTGQLVVTVVTALLLAHAVRRRPAPAGPTPSPAA